MALALKARIMPRQGNSLFQDTQLGEEFRSSSGSFCIVGPRVTTFLVPKLPHGNASCEAPASRRLRQSHGQTAGEFLAICGIFHGEAAQGSQVSTFDVRGLGLGASAAAHTQSSYLNDLHNRQKSCINLFRFHHFSQDSSITPRSTRHRRSIGESFGPCRPRDRCSGGGSQGTRRVAAVGSLSVVRRQARRGHTFSATDH